MKKIITGGQAIGFTTSDNITLQFNGVENKWFDANELTKKQIEEIRKNPSKAKNYIKDLKEIEIPEKNI